MFPSSMFYETARCGPKCIWIYWIIFMMNRSSPDIHELMCNSALRLSEVLLSFLFWTSTQISRSIVYFIAHWVAPAHCAATTGNDSYSVFRSITGSNDGHAYFSYFLTDEGRQRTYGIFETSTFKSIWVELQLMLLRYGCQGQPCSEDDGALEFLNFATVAALDS